MQNSQIPEGNYGSLIVSVRTAGNALPVEGATVTVSNATPDEPAFLRTMQTDISGLTPLLPLSAMPKSDSLVPGIGHPFTVYNIRVVKDGYYVHENRNVPIFAGITSLQPVELIPLAPYNAETTRPEGNLYFSSEQSLDTEEN